MAELKPAIRERQSELELFTKGTNKFVTAANLYCSQLGLPPEAASSVLRAAQAHANLSTVVARQRRLSPEERKNLIRSKNPISTSMLRRVDQLVEAINVPYDTITIIEGEPYIRAEGIRALFQSDPRIPKSLTTEELPVRQIEGNYIVGMKARAEFWNGSVYEDVGYADLNELQARRAKSDVPPSFVAMIAKTRAERRVIRSAIGLPIGLAEDVEEAAEISETPTVEIKVSAPLSERGPKNRAQLLALGMSTYNLKEADLLRILKVNSLSEITDFTEAWKAIKSSMATTTEGEHVNESVNEAE